MDDSDFLLLRGEGLRAHVYLISNQPAKFIQIKSEQIICNKQSSRDLTNEVWRTQTQGQVKCQQEGGFVVLFDREIPFELREEGSERGSLQTLRVRIFQIPDSQDPIKVQLLNENSLFFHYEVLMTRSQFEHIRRQQKINVEFNRFLEMFTKFLLQCVKHPHLNFAVLQRQKTKGALLSIIENIDHKFIQLLNLDFKQVSEEYNAMMVTFRFNLMKAKMLSTAEKVKRVSEIIKIKNPSLLQQLQKSFRNIADSRTESQKSSRVK